MMRIASEAKPSAVFWNRRYQAAEIAIDKRIKLCSREQASGPRASTAGS
jgi:hypothetical protein